MAIKLALEKWQNWLVGAEQSFTIFTGDPIGSSSSTNLCLLCPFTQAPKTLKNMCSPLHLGEQ